MRCLHGPRMTKYDACDGPDNDECNEQQGLAERGEHRKQEQLPQEHEHDDCEQYRDNEQADLFGQASAGDVGRVAGPSQLIAGLAEEAHRTSYASEPFAKAQDDPVAIRIRPSSTHCPPACLLHTGDSG